jgi:hypothetical protein
MANETLGSRIITQDDPNGQHLILLKGGRQIGMIYWVNLDTKGYRRVALWVDFVNGPWEGEGRIVRHPSQADMSKITYSFSQALDMEGTEHPDKIPLDQTYPIDQYPIVSYESLSGSSGCRTTPLTVEGTFDEAMLRHDTPDFIRALYPDLPVRQPKPVEV